MGLDPHFLFVQVLYVGSGLYWISKVSLLITKTVVLVYISTGNIFTRNANMQKSQIGCTRVRKICQKSQIGCTENLPDPTDFRTVLPFLIPNDCTIKI